VIEGGVDSVLYENFIYQTLYSLRCDKATANKDIVLFMDNAIIHRHSSVLETARKFKVNVLFNAEYSPWLNPVETLFSKIKHEMHKKKTPTDK
jgi:transposase